MSFEEARLGNKFEPTKKKRTMTKEDVQVVIREYLSHHLDYFKFPKMERVESFDVFLKGPFNGIGSYLIHGDVKIWVTMNEDNGERQTIDAIYNNCSVTIGSNSDGEPIVQGMNEKIILYKKY